MRRRAVVEVFDEAPAKVECEKRRRKKESEREIQFQELGKLKLHCAPGHHLSVASFSCQMDVPSSPNRCRSSIRQSDDSRLENVITIFPISPSHRHTDLLSTLLDTLLLRERLAGPSNHLEDFTQSDFEPLFSRKSTFRLRIAGFVTKIDSD